MPQVELKLNLTFKVTIYSVDIVICSKFKLMFIFFKDGTCSILNLEESKLYPVEEEFVKA